MIDFSGRADQHHGRSAVIAAHSVEEHDRHSRSLLLQEFLCANLEATYAHLPLEHDQSEGFCYKILGYEENGCVEVFDCSGTHAPTHFSFGLLSFPTGNIGWNDVMAHPYGECFKSNTVTIVSETGDVLPFQDSRVENALLLKLEQIKANIAELRNNGELDLSADVALEAVVEAQHGGQFSIVDAVLEQQATWLQQLMSGQYERFAQKEVGTAIALLGTTSETKHALSMRDALLDAFREVVTRFKEPEAALRLLRSVH